jgi:hypothetical protein
MAKLLSKSHWIESLNRLVVQVYKVVGFVVLTAILAGLVSFFTLNLFYLFDRSWLAPVILSPRHERVVELSSQLAQQTAQRDRLVAELAQLESEAADAGRRLELQNELVQEYAAAATAARSLARDRTRSLAALARRLQARRTEVTADRERFEALMRELLEQRRQAGLVARDDIAATEHQLSELAVSEMALSQSQVELRLERRSHGARLRALDRLVTELREDTGSGQNAESAALTPEVLELFEASKEARLTAKALAAKSADLRDRGSLLKESIARYDRILHEIEDSPYLRAIDGEVTIAFAPYDNLDSLRAGTELYGCHLYLVACKRVGAVVGILEGEVTARHPLTQQELRGQMVEVDLNEGGWARDEAIFAGKRPLWLL